MTPEEQTELWRWAVHNRAFEIAAAISQLRSTLLALGGEATLVHDKWAIAERQLRICALEAEKLQSIIGRIDFKPKES